MTNQPIASAQVPVSHYHLDLVRQELKSDIAGLRIEMRAGLKNIDSRFESIDVRFQSMESILLSMKALLEEQNSRNRIVMDGYASLFDRQEGSIARIDKLEKNVFGFE